MLKGPRGEGAAPGEDFPGVEALREDVRRRFFPAPPRRPLRIGVEAEWIPVLVESGRRVPLHDPGGVGLLHVLRVLGEEGKWVERRSSDGVVSFQLPSRGMITFEPGGQVEYSSPPFAGTAPLLADLEATAQALALAMEGEGIRLLGRGIDPLNSVEGAELYVDSDRYRRMARHFDRCGPAGRRMMRQTAALHVNLDFGEKPLLQWRVANALAPVLIAIFANSSRYGGEESGFRSFRAQQWRELESPSRTTPPDPAADDVERYLLSALHAPAILLGSEDADPLPFAEWVGRVGLDDWGRHLTTLFPEVRPRGYLEIRSCDTLPSRWYAAPVVFLAGILCDPEALEAAALRLPPPTVGELGDAGRCGLEDPARLALAQELWAIALGGAVRLAGFVDSDALARAADFSERFTARGLDPASDPAGVEESPTETV